MKTLKISLVILCLLHVRAVGLPQFSGALSFMGQITIKHKTLGIHVVYFDDADSELIGRYRWYLHNGSASHTIYCMTKKGKFRRYMHRLIMNPKNNELTDHIDKNGLNNRRSNLRVCSSSQNNCYSRRKNSTGFRGVRYVCDRKSYRVDIRFNGKVIHIGSFKDLYTAATAYNQVAIKLHGEFATLNNITSL